MSQAVHTKKTILLADDEENLRLLVHATLEDPRYDIVEACDGVDALSKAREIQPALLIIDWMMPQMTGVEVTRALRSEQTPLAEMPIVMLTAQAPAEYKHVGLAAGATAFLSKPFSPLQLLDCVETLLGRE